MPGQNPPGPAKYHAERLRKARFAFEVHMDQNQGGTAENASHPETFVSKSIFHCGLEVTKTGEA